MTEIHNQLSIIAASYNKKRYQLKNGWDKMDIYKQTLFVQCHSWWS